jgi:hypothetical protein
MFSRRWRTLLTDDVNAKDTVSLLLSQNLDETFHVLVRLGTGVGDEGELANLNQLRQTIETLLDRRKQTNLVLDTIFLQVLLSTSNPRNLRVCVHD